MHLRDLPDHLYLTIHVFVVAKRLRIENDGKEHLDCYHFGEYHADPCGSELHRDRNWEAFLNTTKKFKKSKDKQFLSYFLTNVLSNIAPAKYFEITFNNR
jgi:hypothetical protein